MKGKLGCFGLAALLAVVVAVIWGIGVRNGLVRKDVAVDAAWAQVENAYQRRLDLIPNLVATVKGAAAFEQETFTAVTEARSKASQITLSPEMLNDPEALRRFQQAQGEVSSALSLLLATVENYPDLKATESFRDLMTQLEGTENRIAVERRRFNEVAQDYNTAIRVFPASLIASMSGFGPKAMFQADEGASRAPKVEF